MSKKSTKTATPPRFFASADQYLSSTTTNHDSSKTSHHYSNKSAPESPTPSPSSNVKIKSQTNDNSRKQATPTSQRKYRQMPLTMSVEDNSTYDGNKSWNPDDTGSDDSERLAQYEHESLVKVVARLRDGNYISHTSPQVMSAAYNGSPSPNVTYNHSLPANSLATQNHLSHDSLPNQQSHPLNITPTKSFNFDGNPILNGSSHLPSSPTHFNNYTNGNSPSSTVDQSAFSTTPKSTRILDSRLNEGSMLEASRRQMDAEIAESKRVLQQQLDIQRQYAHTPQKTDSSSNKDQHTLYSYPNELLQGPDANSITSSPEKNDLYTQVQQLESQLRASEKQVQAQRNKYTREIDEMRESHAQVLVELREMHAQDQLSLSRQLRDERAERHRVALKEDETRREAEARLVGVTREAEGREHKLTQQIQELKREAEDRDDTMRDLTRLRAEASAFRTEAEEARARLRDIEVARVQLAEERLRLDEERKRIEDEKRRVEDQRRQYERAGTDVLKVLNDANQKIIALEEHKWKLEDQCTELLGVCERERKTFEQQRSKFEQQVEVYKEEAEKEATERKQEVDRIQAELEVRDREKLAFQDEILRYKELLRSREREADVLRSRLTEVEQQLLKLDMQREHATKAQASEREQWANDQEAWEKEKEGLSNAVMEAQAEKLRLERELDDNRRKFDSVKRLLE